MVGWSETWLGLIGVFFRIWIRCLGARAGSRGVTISLPSKSATASKAALTIWVYGSSGLHASSACAATVLRMPWMVSWSSFLNLVKRKVSESLASLMSVKRLAATRSASLPCSKLSPQ